VIARFQINVECCAFSPFSGGFEGKDFGMGGTCAGMKAFPDNLPILNDYRTN
jgi:hypothetical protein